MVSGVHGYFDLVLCFSFYYIPFSLQIIEVLFLKVCTLFNYEDKEMDDTNLVIHIVPREFTISHPSIQIQRQLQTDMNTGAGSGPYIREISEPSAAGLCPCGANDFGLGHC